MNPTTIAVISSSILGLYIIATGIGNGWPNTRIGKICLRAAYILGAIEKALPETQRTNLIRGQIYEPQSGCEACDIEARIGTEEVPHPIDNRLHTCNPTLVSEHHG